MNIDDRKFVRHHAVYIGEVSTAIHEACHCACAILNQNPIVTAAIGTEPNVPCRYSGSELSGWVYTKTTDTCTTDDLILQAMAPIVASEIWGIWRGGLGGDMEDVEKYLLELPEPDREGVREDNREVLRHFLPANEAGIFRIAHELLRRRTLDGAIVERLFNTTFFKAPRKFRQALRLLPEMHWRSNERTNPELLARWFPSE